VRDMSERLGLGTLHRWAKEDSPERYQILQNNSLEKIIKDIIDGGGTHTDLSILIQKK